MGMGIMKNELESQIENIIKQVRNAKNILSAISNPDNQNRIKFENKETAESFVSALNILTTIIAEDDWKKYTNKYQL